jgi:hypothetical protein
LHAMVALTQSFCGLLARSTHSSTQRFAYPQEPYIIDQTQRRTSVNSKVWHNDLRAESIERLTTEVMWRPWNMLWASQSFCPENDFSLEGCARARKDFKRDLQELLCRTKRDGGLETIAVV